VEVLGVLEQQPPCPFEHVLVELFGGFPVEVAAQVGEFLVEQLDDMEMVEDQDRVGKVCQHGADIRGRHVHGHGFNGGPSTREPVPEGVKGLGSLPVVNKHDGPGDQVQDDRHVPMAPNPKPVV